MQQERDGGKHKHTLANKNSRQQLEKEGKEGGHGKDNETKIPWMENEMRTRVRIEGG